MEARQRNLPNKINEQFMLPVLFVLLNSTLVIWFYLIHEYSQSNKVFEKRYGFDQSTIASYLSELKAEIMLFSIVLLITPLWLKLRKRWLLVAVTLMHVGLLYEFFHSP